MTDSLLFHQSLPLYSLPEQLESVFSCKFQVASPWTLNFSELHPQSWPPPQNDEGIWGWAVIEFWFCDDEEDIVRFLSSDSSNPYGLSNTQFRHSLPCLLFTLRLVLLYRLVLPQWFQLLRSAEPIVWNFCSLSSVPDSSLSDSVPDMASARGCGSCCSGAGTVSLVSPGIFLIRNLFTLKICDILVCQAFILFHKSNPTRPAITT